MYCCSSVYLYSKNKVVVNFTRAVFLVWKLFITVTLNPFPLPIQYKVIVSFFTSPFELVAHFPLWSWSILWSIGRSWAIPSLPFESLDISNTSSYNLEDFKFIIKDPYKLPPLHTPSSSLPDRAPSLTTYVPSRQYLLSILLFFASIHRLTVPAPWRVHPFHLFSYMKVSIVSKHSIFCHCNQ